MVALTQNTDDYYPWWHSPKTPTTIIHGGTHPKHQRLLSMVVLTQTLATIIHGGTHPKHQQLLSMVALTQTLATIIHGGTHPKHQQLLSMVALTQNNNDYYPWWLTWIIVASVWVSATMDNSCWCFG
jgi:hypothetical protein